MTNNNTLPLYYLYDTSSTIKFIMGNNKVNYTTNTIKTIMASR